MRRRVGIGAVVLVCFTAWFSMASAHNHAGNLTDTWDEYGERYGLTDVYQKLNNNHGDGFEPLYGTRNVRQVLRGVVYRGGANNKFHKSNPRNNMNPLPDDGLQNLCKEGFQLSYYLYRENYDASKELNVCQTGPKTQNSLRYLQQGPMSEAGTKTILTSVYNALINPSAGPVYLHCWNGWHASGYISAVVLRQFCDWGAEEAVSYWDINTDGHNNEPQYERIRNRIRNFVPYPEFAIANELKLKVCQN